MRWDEYFRERSNIFERDFVAVGREAFFAQFHIQVVDVFLFGPCFFADLAQLGEIGFLFEQMEGFEISQSAQPRLAGLGVVGGNVTGALHFADNGIF